MINADIDYLDGEFTVQENEPSLLSEVTALIGEDGVVDETVSNLRYRNKYPRVYRKVSEAIRTKFPRAEKSREPQANGKPDKVVYISETDHLRQYLATGDAAREELQSLFTSFGTSEPLYVQGERGGGGKISQGALDAANAYLAAGDDTVNQVITAIEGAVPGYKITRADDGTVTPESLARGMQALDRHLKSEAKKAKNKLLPTVPVAA